MKSKNRKNLDEILAETSDVLFPHLMGKKIVKVNSKDVMGDTPLHIMTRRQDRYAVARLVEAGANVNAQGDMGETPLHVAISVENSIIANLLIKNGADANIKSEFGDSPRERAIATSKEFSKLFGSG